MDEIDVQILACDAEKLNSGKILELQGAVMSLTGFFFFLLYLIFFSSLIPCIVTKCEQLTNFIV